MSWELAIDFGTTSSCGAVRDADGTRLLDVQRTRHVPSAVHLDPDGNLIAGEHALRALRRPHLVERVALTPKRELGQSTMVLGGTQVKVADAVAAVLRLLLDEGMRQHGGTAPDRIVLTHPAAWDADGDRAAALRAAAAVAGMPVVELVPEPVAAAAYHTGRSGRTGGFIAVYDLGGGTFDAAVLQRTADGYELAGPPGGDEGIGGEDFDHLVREFYLERVAASDPRLADDLRHGAERSWHRARASLREEAQRAKEALTDNPTAYVHAGDDSEHEYRITRDEFERMIESRVLDTLDEFEATLDRADLDAAQLDAIYLTGGASRIPVVARLMSERFREVTVTAHDDPKTIVALGALQAARPTQDRAEHPQPVPVPAPAQAAGPTPATTAMADLFAAITGGDLLAACALLTPYEADLLTGTLPAVADELVRLGVLRPGWTPADDWGVSLTVARLDLDEYPSPDPTVLLTDPVAGLLTYSVNADRIPLADWFADRAGLDGALDDFSDTVDIAAERAVDPAPLPLAVLDSGGRWLPSLAYTALALWLLNNEQDWSPPQVAPVGADTPEEAVRALVTAVICNGFDDACAVLVPFESRWALSFPAEPTPPADSDQPLRIGELDLDRQATRPREVELSLRRLTLVERGETLEIWAGADGASIQLVEGGQVTMQGRLGTLLAMLVENQVPAAQRNLVERLVEIADRLTIGQIRVVTVEVDGRWYVSVARTVVALLLTALRTLSGRDVLLVVDMIRRSLPASTARAEAALATFDEVATAAGAPPRLAVALGAELAPGEVTAFAMMCFEGLGLVRKQHNVLLAVTDRAVLWAVDKRGSTRVTRLERADLRNVRLNDKGITLSLVPRRGRVVDLTRYLDAATLWPQALQSINGHA